MINKHVLLPALAAAGTLALLGCDRPPHLTAEAMGDERAAACRVELWDHYTVVPEHDRNQYMFDCITAGGFQHVECNTEGSFREDGSCWLEHGRLVMLRKEAPR